MSRKPKPQGPRSQQGRRQFRESEFNAQYAAKRGGIYGVVTYIVGYLLTLALYSIDNDIGDNIGGSTPATDGTGWIFYNAHFVKTQFTGTSGDFDSEITGEINFLLEDNAEFSGAGEAVTLSFDGTGLPELFYLSIPVIVLVAGGYMLLQNSESLVSSSQEAMKIGATIVTGYFPLAVLGAILFEYTENDGGVELTGEPNLATAAVIAGLLFPIILGAVGGYLYYQRNSSSSQVPRGRRTT
jgi:hypothetical protein